MRNSFARSTGLRRFGFSASDGDLDPDTDDDTPTGDESIFDLDHMNKFRQLFILDALNNTDADPIVLELKIQGGGWEQTSVYQQEHLNSNTDLAVVDTSVDVDWPGAFNGAKYGSVYITSAGLAVPTRIKGRLWRETNQCWEFSCFVNTLDKHSDARFRVVGGGVFDGVGTVRIMRQQ